MNSPDQKWPRLVSAARRAEDVRDETAPYGFSTRVAALAFARERTGVSLLERFAWRALCVAGLLAVLSTAANYSLFSSAVGEDDTLTDDNTVSALLDFSS
ncbi:MAG: hypothetical protein JWM88_1973 [Verrucomicrobia bacterium]|nr:hypothetical protein [Verrucomicrobiota bacterium]